MKLSGGMLYVPLLIVTHVADPRLAAVLAQPIIVGAAMAGLLPASQALDLEQCCTDLRYITDPPQTRNRTRTREVRGRLGHLLLRYLMIPYRHFGSVATHPGSSLETVLTSESIMICYTWAIHEHISCGSFQRIPLLFSEGNCSHTSCHWNGLQPSLVDPIVCKKQALLKRQNISNWNFPPFSRKLLQYCLATPSQRAKIIRWTSGIGNDRSMPRWEFSRFHHESIVALHFDYDFASDLGSHLVIDWKL